MKISKSQLRRIIKEEKQRLLSEQAVPQSLLEQLTAAMTAILDHVENTSGLHPDDVPLEVKEIIENEVAGFMEYLGSGMEY